MMEIISQQQYYNILRQKMPIASVKS